MSKSLDVLLRDSVNGALNLLDGLAAARGDDLATNVGGGALGGGDGEEELGLELGLGALDLGLGHGDSESVPFLEGKVDGVVEVGDVVRDNVDTPETGIAV